MTRQPHTEELMRLVSELDPAPADRVREQLIESELNAARERARTLATRPGPRARPSGRKVVVRTAGLAAAGAVAIVIAIFGGGIGDSGGGRSAFAEEAVEVAEANPRLLVTAPGWSVTSANQFEPDEGEIRFGKGGHELSMNWYPADAYQDYYEDRSYVQQTSMSFPELGPSRTVRYSSTDFATMLKPEGDVFLEIRATLPAGEYRKVLASLEPVDVGTWLRAMPATVVQPADRSAAVEEIAADMPLPPGLDLTRVRDEAAVLDRYHLIAKTAGFVACGWLDRWAAAVESGDAAKSAQAIQAMQTARDWKALREIEGQGGYSDVLWRLADAMREDRRDLLLGHAGADMLEDGRAFAFGPKYATALGCDSEYRRLVKDRD
jgi:hypothetical protein